MSLPPKVKIFEVGPRDGLQSEQATILAEHKASLIGKLFEAGLEFIEAGSFVSPKAVPAMANTEEVIGLLSPQAGLTTLVPNLIGMQKAIEQNIRTVAVFASASESFSQKNIRCSIAESLQRFEPILALAQSHNIHVRGYVSCIAGCPYEGEVSLQAVANVSAALYEMGCYEISLGDTVGIGTPLQITRIIDKVAEVVPLAAIALHCHDTYGQALANIYAALQKGVQTFDASIAGLGGCPYAPGASGNIATEDVVYMLDGLGIESGVSLEKLLAAAHFVKGVLNLPIRSKVTQARGV